MRDSGTCLFNEAADGTETILNRSPVALNKGFEIQLREVKSFMVISRFGLR